jgi:galactose mutarotase-like enzyme
VSAGVPPAHLASAAVEPPSGLQHRLVHGDQEAVVTEVGATLRAYTVGGRPAILGFDVTEHATHARGQLLLPWPGRVGNGRYRWQGVDHQLPLDEEELTNAIHGLVRWSNWTAETPSANRVVMRYRLHPRDGYPFCLDLVASFELADAGLRATLSGTNLSGVPAPFGAGVHPYLAVDGERVDGWRLAVPAETRLRTDSRMLPIGRAPVAGTEFDFREPRVIGSTQLDTAYTDLVCDPDGLTRVSLEAPDGRRLVLWTDSGCPWLVLFSADPLPSDERRRGLAVEPMTCPPDAFRSGEDLIALQPGETATLSWGIDVTGFRP